MSIHLTDVRKPAVAAILLLILLLSGCGQKGDLYLPSTQTVVSPDLHQV